jgi:flavin-dependent dehydrogenase
MVCRDEFDAALVDRAAQAGAIVRDGVSVTRLAEGDGVVELMTAAGYPVRARAVVGADGSASRAGRHVGVRCSQVDLGLEVELPMPPEQADRWEGRLLIDWGIDGSYGWVFPKGESLSVGVIASRGRGDGTRAYLRDFLAGIGLDQVPPAVSSGHLTRCREDDSPLSRGRVLVAGDAAGLLDPLTREGISFALRSGTRAGVAAARVAEAGSAEDVSRITDAYASELSATLGAEMRAGRLLMAVFSRRPWVFHAALTRVPQAWRLFIRVVAGETTLAHVIQRPAVRLPAARLRR